MARLLEDGDELALPWDELADGRAWDLVRGRDFFCNPREVEEAARNAATRLGKAVQTVRSLHASVSSIWVQFADHRIEAGMPCPCGSDELRRVNDEYAICASCGASLLISGKRRGADDAAATDDGEPAADGSDGGERLRIFVPEGGRMRAERKRLDALRRAPLDPEQAAALERAREGKRLRGEEKARIRETRDSAQPQPGKKRFRAQLRLERAAEGTRRKPRGRGASAPGPPRPAGGALDRFTDVRLWERKAKRPGQYSGCGYDAKGRLVLFEVTLRVTAEGVPVEDPTRPGRALHSVHVVRTAPFADAVDADALLAKPGGLSPDDVLRLGPR